MPIDLDNLDAPGLDLWREGAVLWIRLNRPDRRNAIDIQSRDVLRTLLWDLNSDPAVRAVVLTGTGRDYCTGADAVASDPAATGAVPPDEKSGAAAWMLDYRFPTQGFQDMFKQLWELEKPVVSAVNGTVAGIGWMFALLADLVVASESARWTHVFTRRGMMPHAGDPYFLPRVLPHHVLNEIAFLSDPVTSDQLRVWGAVNRVVPADQVEQTARELANRLASGPTRSLGQAKRLYRRSSVSDMATAFAEEQSTSALLSLTHDRLEGMQAFMQGRAPEFTGE
ncbi:MAG: enoyl-CoA hydratase-related protein [Acidimicrobiales bacterium]